jgi:hypothetical protein
MSLIMNRTGAVVQSFQHHREFFVAGAIALGLSLLVAVTNSQAQTNFFWATSVSGNWADAGQWYTTNGAGAFVTGYDWPADINNGNDANYQNDTAWITNAGTYTINVNITPGPYGGPGQVNYASNMFANASGTVMNVTMNIGPGLSMQPGSADGIVIGESAGSTTIVSFVSSGGTMNMGASGPALVVGHNGFGELIVTNSALVATGGAISLGDNTGSVGVVIVSGANTFLNMSGSGHLNVGIGHGPGGCTLILSNSASISCANFRMGCSSAGGTTSNVMFISDGALLYLSGGHAVVGNRAANSGGTNDPSCDNTLILKNSGYGDSSNHTFAIGWADNDVNSTPPSTGNVVIVDSGSSFTNISSAQIRPNNSLYVYGGTFGGGYTNIFGGGTTNQGSLTCWGTLKGQIVNATGGVMIVSNNAGPLTITRGLRMETGSVIQVALGSTYNPITVGSNVWLNGKINFIDSGGFNTVGNHTYLLFTHNTTTNFISGTTTNLIPYYADTNNLTIGPVPGFPSATYTISLPDINTVNLIVGGIVPPLPFQITSITKSGNDMIINWNTHGTNSQFNYVQAAPVTNYNASAFFDIATNIIAGTTASYTDTGGATNRPNRYYRVRSPQ